jgi:hypothetical protein
MRSVKLRLQLSQDNGVYQAEVIWARCGRCGVVLEDTTGYWKDMPEKIEAAVYDGLSAEDMDRMKAEPPANATLELPDENLKGREPLYSGQFEAHC